MRLGLHGFWVVLGLSVKSHGFVQSRPGIVGSMVFVWFMSFCTCGTMWVGIILAWFCCTVHLRFRCGLRERGVPVICSQGYVSWKILGYGVFLLDPVSAWSIAFWVTLRDGWLIVATKYILCFGGAGLLSRWACCSGLDMKSNCTGEASVAVCASPVPVFGFVERQGRKVMKKRWILGSHIFHRKMGTTQDCLQGRLPRASCFQLAYLEWNNIGRQQRHVPASREA